jgi:hypothetical protein
MRTRIQCGRILNSTTKAINKALPYVQNLNNANKKIPLTLDLLS